MALQQQKLKETFGEVLGFIRQLNLPFFGGGKPKAAMYIVVWGGGLVLRLSMTDMEYQTVEPLHRHVKAGHGRRTTFQSWVQLGAKCKAREASLSTRLGLGDTCR